MKRAHPADGALRALLDSELRPWTALRVRLHLRGCAECRQTLGELSVRGATIASLLRGAAPEIDADEAWARFVVRSGGRAGAGAGRRAISRRAWSAAIAVAVTIVVLALLTPDLVPPDDGDLLAMVRVAQAHGGEVVRDACCEDHDGGAHADDGLLTLNLPGERVVVVVIYEDVDGSGTFTPGDIVRYVSKSPQSHLMTRYAR